MLRENPHSWLSRLEKEVGGTVLTSFFFEALTKHDTTPEPFDPANSLRRSPPLALNPSIETLVEGVRLVEAFLTLPDGSMIRSPKKALTFYEAIESAALEWFKGRITKEDLPAVLSKCSSSSSTADEFEEILPMSAQERRSRKAKKK